MVDIIVKQNCNNSLMTYLRQKNTDTTLIDYWRSYHRKYMFQPIFDISQKLFGIELLTSVSSIKQPSKKISPEIYFSKINISDRVTIFSEQLHLLFEFSGYFTDKKLLASVNIDSQTLLQIQTNNSIKKLINIMPWLRLELVEHNNTITSTALHNLSEMNLLWLDDFGCGMANFSSLIQMKYDSIKIARELFILLLNHNNGQKMLHELIVVLNSYCNYIIVEGVETKQEWDIVRRSGAHAAQGYYLSKPQNFDKINTLFSN
ncbi:TPA: cyclic-guanylate-specific phosphodiesterase [Morganella morganii]|uniref:Cyclic-guanylate-specific phosphodiesterase n=1 Tax=bacterium 19GA11TI05 TaxID=2920688 RepID=A0AAU6TY66_UNCXX|nr:cyclic-guanylate-specific phosphodiesterase [Morganella morganii]HCC5750018.1 cyclic-guanylate-specific phosphodiesterase [Morganella morganii]